MFLLIVGVQYTFNPNATRGFGSSLPGSSNEVNDVCVSERVNAMTSDVISFDPVMNSNPISLHIVFGIWC